MGNDRRVIGESSRAPDRDCVGALYRANGSAIRSFCRRLLSDSDLADDALQQTFEIALTSIRELRDPGRSRAWIFQIARNECIRLLKRPPLCKLDEDDADDQIATPLQATIDSDLRSLVQDAIDRLPPIYREAVLLRDLEGFAYAEIASITTVTVAAVKFRIFRGRELLMKMLQPVLKEWRMP